MKHFPIRVGVCGVLAFAAGAVLAAGAVWAQQQPPAIKPMTPSALDTAKPAPVPVRPSAFLGEPFPFVPQQIHIDGPGMGLSPQPIFCWSGSDQRDICAIEALINRTINLGNFGFNTKKLADVLEGGVPKAAGKAKAVQAEDVNPTPNILLAGGETLQLAQAGKENPPASPESKQLAEEINKVLKMKADVLRSMDIGGLYRPSLPMIQPCISYIPHGLYTHAFPNCGPTCGHPFGGHWPGVGPLGGAPVAGLHVAGIQVGTIPLGGHPRGGWAGGMWAGAGAPGTVVPGVVAPGAVVPGVVAPGMIDSGFCGPCGGGPYVEGCAMVLTGRTGFCLLLLPNEARFALGLAPNLGLYIKVVHPKTPADLAGYKAGDILIEFDGKAVPGNFTDFLDKIMRFVKNDTPIDGVVLRAGVRVEIKNMILTDRRVIPPLPNECPLDVVLPQIIQLVPGINSALPAAPVRELRAVAHPGGITEFIWVDPTPEKK